MRRNMQHAWLATSAILCTALAGCGGPQVSERAELKAAAVAKAVCSGVFVDGRDAAAFMAGDLRHLGDLSGIEVAVDRDRRVVTSTAAGLVERLAVFHEGYGCTVLPRGQPDVLFDPVPVRSTLPGADLQAWPMGDRVPDSALPHDIDAARLAAAVDLAFAEQAPGPAVGTRALLVVHRGRIIAERYAPGFDQDSRMISWSMGKSLTAALVGLLVGDGYFDLDDPAPITEWHAPGDPRHGITIRHLLQMSSGLACSRLQPDDANYFTHRNDHTYVYFEGIDVFAHAIRRPLEHPPGTVGRYRNCDPLVLGQIIRDTVEARGDSYHAFPQQALFDRIGIRDMVLEPDPYGNMILTGYDHGTARDWARFGLLHLQDGVWLGRRILPEGWVDFVSSPAPAWPEGNYGGLFWRNGDRRLADVPEDAYWAAGARGQRTFIIPSHDLVVVRMGYSLDDEALTENLNRMLSAMVAAVGPSRSSGRPTD